MQKGATRATNDSMDGSIYRPGNFTSEETSDESTDEVEVLSDVETETSCDEDSLSDISEEEESTASMASHRMMSLSTETSLTSSLGSLHRSMKVHLSVTVFVQGFPKIGVRASVCKNGISSILN